MVNDLDAHAKPPVKLREVYKEYQKLKTKSVENYPGLIQFDASCSPSHNYAVPTKGAELPSELRNILMDFLRDEESKTNDSLQHDQDQRPIYQVPNIPGKVPYAIQFPQMSEKGRPLNLSISFSTSVPALPPRQAPPPRHLQSATPHQCPPSPPSPLHSPFNILLLAPIIGPLLSTQRPLSPQTLYDISISQQETPLVHPRRAVRLDRQTIPFCPTATLSCRYQVPHREDIPHERRSRHRQSVFPWRYLESSSGCQ